MTESLLTPSKITAWLDCDHFLTLSRQVQAGTREDPAVPLGSLARLLMDKGITHESDCLVAFRSEGRTVHEVPARIVGEPFADWVERVGNPLEFGFDVIYQMPLVHDGVRGIADFLVRRDDPESGRCQYEPVDAKLARSDGRPGHVLQLCFYAEALASLTGSSPKYIHLWLGSGNQESLVTDDFLPYWTRLRSSLASLLEAQDDGVTAPEPCPYCKFCAFQEACTAQWREADSLVYVAELRSNDRFTLEEDGVETLDALASLSRDVPGVDPERLGCHVTQATLQLEARENGDKPPPFRVTPPSDEAVWGRGFEHLPGPDEGDVFLDFEGDPFWRADVGLFFLFGLIERDPDGNWRYRAFWAHNREQEAVATGDLVEYLAARRDAFPDMHVYHYNHTERSALESLTTDHGVAEETLADLVETGLFVDLYRIVLNAVQAGVESYGLKSLELLTGYQRHLHRHTE